MPNIRPLRPEDRDAILALSLRAWAPVFAELRRAMPAYVYRAFYPDGWEQRQTADIAALLDDHDNAVWVAEDGDEIAGWIGVRLHPGDSMGEVHILAVDPDRQRQGIAAALLDAGLAHMRQAGMTIAMVETGADPGHAPARAAYERRGFELLPVARYFRPL